MINLKHYYFNVNYESQSIRIILLRNLVEVILLYLYTLIIFISTRLLFIQAIYIFLPSFLIFFELTFSHFMNYLYRLLPFDNFNLIFHILILIIRLSILNSSLHLISPFPIIYKSLLNLLMYFLIFSIHLPY